MPRMILIAGATKHWCIETDFGRSLCGRRGRILRRKTFVAVAATNEGSAVCRGCLRRTV